MNYKGGRNNLFIFVIQFFCLILFFLSFSLVKSASPTIIINEVSWAGSSKSSSDEWIELKNISNVPINIKGWEIISAATAGRSLNIPLDRNYVISPGQLFLIANYDLGDAHTVINIKPDIVDTSLSLSNQGNGNLILKNENGENIDEILGGNWPAGDNDKKASMERIDGSSGLDPRNWQSANTQTNIIPQVIDLATPKATNSQSQFGVPKNYSTQITDNLNLNNALEAEGVVTRIIDADTIEVLIGNALYKVRLIGIDSPEGKSSSSFNTDEPYYVESKQFTIDNLLNNHIQLLVNSDARERFDNYSRLLAVIINNDKIFNLQLLENGLARSYYLDNALVISHRWRAFEETAKINHIGLWKYFGNECIAVNEFMPNPAGSDSDNEWIELTNNCDMEINVKNWFLDDREGGSYPYLFANDHYIAPHGYLVISAPESHLGLNNDADTVRLFSPDLNIASEISYSDDAKENNSYACIDSVWQWSNYPTPGSKNSLGNAADDLLADGYKQIASLDKLRNESKNTHVSVSAYVNVAPGTFGKQYFYIQDKTGGSQIYFSEGVFPTLSIGDLVTVKGDISDTPYLRIKIDNKDNITVLSVSNIVNIFELSGDNTIQYEGRLVKMHGTVSDKKSRAFYIDNNKKIKIQFKDNVKMPKFGNGDIVDVTGVVSVDSHNNIILLPRSESDINIKYNDAKNNQINEIKNQEEFLQQKIGSRVKAKAIITATAGMIDDRYMYIQSDDLALQVYNAKKQFPVLNVGDEISVTGKISTKQGRLILANLADIEIISTNNPLNIYKLVDQDINSFYQRLVNVSGTVIAKKGNTFLIGNNKNTYQVYLKNKIKSQFKIKVGDYIEAVGIVEKYQDQLKITPRITNDVQYWPTAKSILSKISKTSSHTGETYLTTTSRVKGNKYLASGPINQYNNCTINNLLISLAISAILLVFIIRITIYATNVYYKKNKRILRFN